MNTYFIVHARMKDEGIYRKYLEQCDEVFEKYNGEYLAVDQNYEVIEGKCDYSRVIIITFKNKEDFDKWYYSGDYQRIVKYRLEGAECDSILVHGK